MSVGLTYVWTALVLDSLMVLIYLVTLVKALIGTGYKFVIVTILMLLLSNLFYIVLLICNYTIFKYLEGDIILSPD
jgi:hypothetical protein